LRPSAVAFGALAGHAALRLFDEGDQVGDLRVVGNMGGLERADRIGEIGIFLEEEFFVGVLDGLDVFLRKAPALQADGIDSTGAGRVAIDDHEWRHVLHDFCHAADNRMLADAAELVDSAHAGDDGMVINGHVTCQANRVGEDDVTAELAIVGNVGVTKQQVV